VEVKFWHGVESYLTNGTFDFMQQIMYSVEIKEDTEEY
jgi:hypothetical protein